ncbi:MAG: hypothetical protein SGI73_02245 [Chloroflexota bacterium]|nr:hypothetical protein [Chloroflexota bacterium]
MRDNEALRGVLSLGGFIGIGGLILIFLQPAGSAEQVLSVCSAVMGAVLVGGAVLVTRVWRQRGS